MLTMSIHRLVAAVSATVLIGLLGAAQASNFARPAKETATVHQTLREKIENANIEGCG